MCKCFCSKITFNVKCFLIAISQQVTLQFCEKCNETSLRTDTVPLGVTQCHMLWTQNHFYLSNWHVSSHGSWPIPSWFQLETNVRSTFINLKIPTSTSVCRSHACSRSTKPEAMLSSTRSNRRSHTDTVAAAKQAKINSKEETKTRKKNKTKKHGANANVSILTPRLPSHMDRWTGGQTDDTVTRLLLLTSRRLVGFPAVGRHFEFTANKCFVWIPKEKWKRQQQRFCVCFTCSCEYKSSFHLFHWSNPTWIIQFDKKVHDDIKPVGFPPRSRWPDSRVRRFCAPVCGVDGGGRTCESRRSAKSSTRRLVDVGTPPPFSPNSQRPVPLFCWHGASLWNRGCLFYPVWISAFLRPRCLHGVHQVSTRSHSLQTSGVFPHEAT